LLVAGTAEAAAGPDPARADALFEEGKARLAAGDWAGACLSFRQSLELDVSVSTLVKIARCEEHDGRLASALLEYRRAEEHNRALTQNVERQRELGAVIESAIKELEPRVPRLDLDVSPKPSGIEVTIDGKPVSAALDAPLPLDPGEHEVVVRAPGHREQRLVVSASPGTVRELDVRLVPDDAQAASSLAEPPRAPIARGSTEQTRSGASDSGAVDPGADRRLLGLVVGGVGVATLGVAGYYGIRTLSLVDDSEPHCPDNECNSTGYDLVDRAKDAQTTALILTGIGAVMLGAGTLLYVTAPAADEQDGLVWGIGPGRVSIGGSF
jgi:hypothetical protein